MNRFAKICVVRDRFDTTSVDTSEFGIVEQNKSLANRFLFKQTGAYPLHKPNKFRITKQKYVFICLLWAHILIIEKYFFCPHPFQIAYKRSDHTPILRIVD